MGIRSIFAWLLISTAARAAVPDQPFLQDVSVKLTASSALTNAVLRKLCLDENGVAYVLTDRGVARAFGEVLALDESFRPLAGKVARDIALGPQGDVYYLFDDRWLSNGDNGKPLGHLPSGRFERLAVQADGTVLVCSSNQVALATQDGIRPWEKLSALGPVLLFPLGSKLYALAQAKVLRVEPDGNWTVLAEREATTLALRGRELLIGTHNGFYGIDTESAEITHPLEARLPAIDITRLIPAPDGLWVGTTRGVFFVHATPSPAAEAGTQAGTAARALLPDGPNGIRYYASQRWLPDDYVLDLARDDEGSIWVLSKTGLSRLEFRPGTLAQKAEFFDRKIRDRHIRFGLAGERRLRVGGDISSSEIVDTDNDGGWSSYYLASQAFRFAVSGNPRARQNAWETFGALERLQSINPLPGFPARTFERAGFKFSDPDRWREVPGGDWEWKGHTSSDEIASQTFAHAVLWECVAKTEPERQRVATNYTRIIDHILAHDLYLVDVDGKPTLWGRWNPEYVNWYPHSIFDRRLNSAEIVASLQLAYKMSGNESYRQKAYELFEKHGYLTNILSSMDLIKETKGYVHLDNQMGDEWNHSDDELAFVTYWVLYRFAFTDELRTKYAKAIRGHWEMERAEAYPMWNFIYAGCGAGTHCDPESAVWTLRCYPLDTITWQIDNSHRKDLTRLAPNFMGRELRELLPPGERPITRCNTQPFIFDGGDGGHTEFPGDEYLLGYWLGRYLKLIE